MGKFVYLAFSNKRYSIRLSQCKPYVFIYAHISWVRQTNVLDFLYDKGCCRRYANRGTQFVDANCYQFVAQLDSSLRQCFVVYKPFALEILTKCIATKEIFNLLLVILWWFNVMWSDKVSLHVTLTRIHRHGSRFHF